LDEWSFVTVLDLQETPSNPQGGRMYESPKLVRFGQFRDLTLQPPTCPGSAIKNVPVFDAAIPLGTNDGCPVARS